MFIETVQPSQPTVFHKVHDAFLRALALAVMLLAGYAWLRLVGYYEGTPWRFDLMATHWRVATVLVAIVGPVAGLGLWLLASWGVALWIGIAFFQIIIFSAAANTFEPRPYLVMFHAVGLAIYAAIWLRIFFIDRARTG